MVKQRKQAKTSSRKATIEIRSILTYQPKALVNVAAKNGTIYGEYDEEEYIDRAKWRESPLIAFANLRSYEGAKEVALTEETCIRFLKIYGGPLFGPADLDDTFSESLADLKNKQQLLRDAWNGDGTAKTEIEAYVEDEANVEEHIHVETVQLHYGYIGLNITSLWVLIAMQFLQYEAAGKLGFCTNPNCGAPYFVRKRRTQKFCDLGPCTQFAKQQYALRWWRETGDKIRKERQKKGASR